MTLYAILLGSSSSSDSAATSCVLLLLIWLIQKRRHSSFSVCWAFLKLSGVHVDKRFGVCGPSADLATLLSSALTQ